MSLPTDIKPKRGLIYRSWRIWETVSGIAVAIAMVSFGLIYVLTPDGTVVLASDLQVSLEKVDNSNPPYIRLVIRATYATRLM